MFPRQKLTNILRKNVLGLLIKRLSCLFSEADLAPLKSNIKYFTNIVECPCCILTIVSRWIVHCGTL